MSATETNVQTSNELTSVLAGMPEAIKWTNKGTKLIHGNVNDLQTDEHLNIRFRAGSQLFGVTVSKDTYDLPTMRVQIVDGGGILEPIWVSQRSDKSLIVLRGNRRTLAGKELLADPTISPELRNALTTKTPILLLTGLTPEQERDLINDQTQMSFRRSEVVRNIFELRRNKWDFARIAMLHWETLGKFTQSAKKVAEMRAILDPAAKREKIKSWLRGTLDNYLIWGYDLGTFVQKCILLSCMATDGLLSENDEKPYFNSEKNSQKRIAALRKAKEADGAKFNGQILVEGSEFKKVMDSFHAEDYGTTTTPAVPAGPKMMKRQDLEGVKDSFQSQAVRQMIERVLGVEQPTLTARDEFAASQETKEMLAETYLPRLNPEAQKIVRMFLVNPDPNDFQAWLESQVSENPATENPTPAAE